MYGYMYMLDRVCNARERKGKGKGNCSDSRSLFSGKWEMVDMNNG